MRFFNVVKCARTERVFEEKETIQWLKELKNQQRLFAVWLNLMPIRVLGKLPKGNHKDPLVAHKMYK